MIILEMDRQRNKNKSQVFFFLMDFLKIKRHDLCVLDLARRSVNWSFHKGEILAIYIWISIWTTALKWNARNWNASNGIDSTVGTTLALHSAHQFWFSSSLYRSPSLRWETLEHRGRSILWKVFSPTTSQWKNQK